MLCRNRINSIVKRLWMNDGGLVMFCLREDIAPTGKRTATSIGDKMSGLLSSLVINLSQCCCII